ncbi:anaphase-promoting complex subunit 16 [Lingula anatina]|uniref:Anaphase-promoting complex subunit 16 n=1 Tax=Lingula anatina TaxID=7574 RepID=A0A1S3HZW9_LINAN|nr:anaphase-promoting complex subunit 16 [Lingula anatina]|eukprot:XP_013391562.1 anaphase-promoting complex subunit 16 [Lingula anatina]
MAEGEVQDNIRKALFRSPAVDQAQSSDITDTLMSKLQIEQDVETSVRILHKEQHEQTLKQLRQKLKDLTKDDWRYQPVNQLIGLE